MSNNAAASTVISGRCISRQMVLEGIIVKVKVRQGKVPLWRPLHNCSDKGQNTAVRKLDSIIFDATLHIGSVVHHCWLLINIEVYFCWSRSLKSIVESTCCHACFMNKVFHQRGVATKMAGVDIALQCCRNHTCDLQHTTVYSTQGHCMYASSMQGEEYCAQSTSVMTVDGGEHWLFISPPPAWRRQESNCQPSGDKHCSPKPWPGLPLMGLLHATSDTFDSLHSKQVYVESGGIDMTYRTHTTVSCLKPAGILYTCFASRQNIINRNG